MATVTAITWAAVAGVTITAGAAAADTITDGVIVAIINTQIPLTSTFVDPLPR
jgi:hypothetical protein